MKTPIQSIPNARNQDFECCFLLGIRISLFQLIRTPKGLPHLSGWFINLTFIITWRVMLFTQ
jgi:hypothetical protein